MATVGSFKPQRGKFTPVAFAWLKNLKVVSNPNGVNLHVKSGLTAGSHCCFKPQRGKFTQRRYLLSAPSDRGFKPQRGKFTLIPPRLCFSTRWQFQTPTG